MRFYHPLLTFLPLWCFVALFKFAAGLHYTLLPALGERVFPVATVGILVAAASLLQLLFDLPAGLLLDRYGCRRFLGVTTAAFSLAGIVLLFGLSKTTLLITFILSVAGWLFFEPGVNAYLLAHVPTAFAGSAMALRDVLDAAGVAVAAGVFTFLLGVPVPMVGLLLSAVFAVTAIALSFVPRDRVSVHAERKHPAHHHLIRRSRLNDIVRALVRLNPASAMLLISGFAANAFYATVWFVVPVLVGRELLNGIPGIGLGVFDLTVVLVGFFIGRLADRWNHWRLIFTGLLIFSIAGSLLGFSVGVWFILLGFLATTGDEMASISLWTWLKRLDHRHTEDAAVAGAIAMVHDFGWTVGPLLAGFLFEAVGPAWTIASGAAIVFLAWIACVMILGPRRALALAPFPRETDPRPHRRRHKR